MLIRIMFATQTGGSLLGESSYQMSLNGIWKFSYAKNMTLVPVDFEKEEVIANWEDIRVSTYSDGRI